MNDESRSKGAAHEVPAKSPDAIIPPPTDNVPRDTDGWDEVARVVRGAFVVVVTVVAGDDVQYRRRVFLTIKAAQGAAEKARARGQVAEVVLAELAPLFRVTAGGAL